MDRKTSITRQVLLLPVLLVMGLALGGCSVFGVATKGNLEDLEEQQRAQYQELGRRVQQVDIVMNDIEADLRGVENRLTQQVEANQQQTAALEKDVEDIVGRFQTALGDLQVIRSDIEFVAGRADRAAIDSRQSLRMHKDVMLKERDHLLQRLEHIDQLMRDWQETERQDISTIVPERPYR